MDWTDHFGQVLPISKKKYCARSGLTFLITELCFGDQIVKFGGIWVNLVGRLHLAKIMDKKMDSTNYFGQILTISKFVSALDEA